MNFKKILNLIEWIIGIFFILIGTINLFWGNDPFYGLFIILLSIIYIPPFQNIIKKKTKFSIPTIAKIVIGLFILWSAIGVGELFDKVEIMKKDMF